MKRLFLLLLTAIMLFSFTACGKTEAPIGDSEIDINNTNVENYVVSWSPESYPNEHELLNGEYFEPIKKEVSCVDEIHLQGKYGDSLPTITNSAPLNEILSELTDSWTLCINLRMLRAFTMSPIYDEQMLYGYSLQNAINNNGERPFQKAIPFNFLRKMENAEGWFYTVCKYSDGYVYFILGPKPQYGTIDDTIDYSDLYIYGAVYCIDNLSYSDFGNIKVGDSILSVIDVDKTAETAIVINRYYSESINKDTGINPYEKRVSVHLLQDGILEISYEPKDAVTFEFYGQTLYESNDNLIVSDIRYFKNFDYCPDLTNGVGEIEGAFAVKNVAYDSNGAIPIHILPQDYPPAN